jgi:protein SCO1/2
MMKARLTLLGGIAAILLAAAAGFYFLRPHTFHGTVLQSTDTAYDFTLHVAGDKTVKLSDFRGKLVVIYFGYTFCPDVCPATLGAVTQALRDLGTKADEVQVIMVSVDPERDTPEKLAEYVRHFNPTFIGGTNTPEEIARIASLYGIFYEVSQQTTGNGEYLIDHTATLMVIDRNGSMKLVFPFGVTGSEIAEDLKYMLR